MILAASVAPSACAGADQRVQFIDEQQNAPFAGDDFFEERFEAIFKFAAVFCAGDHRAEVHGHEPFYSSATQARRR